MGDDKMKLIKRILNSPYFTEPCFWLLCRMYQLIGFISTHGIPIDEWSLRFVRWRSKLPVQYENKWLLYEEKK